jgi:hypothetical protein
MDKKLDAVSMVREIRDRLSVEMENIEDGNLADYLNARGKRAEEELREMFDK